MEYRLMWLIHPFHRFLSAQCTTSSRIHLEGRETAVAIAYYLFVVRIFVSGCAKTPIIQQECIGFTIRDLFAFGVILFVVDFVFLFFFFFLIFLSSSLTSNESLNKFSVLNDWWWTNSVVYKHAKFVIDSWKLFESISALLFLLLLPRWILFIKYTKWIKQWASIRWHIDNSIFISIPKWNVSASSVVYLLLISVGSLVQSTSLHRTMERKQFSTVYCLDSEIISSHHLVRYDMRDQST